MEWARKEGTGFWAEGREGQRPGAKGAVAFPDKRFTPSLCIQSGVGRSTRPRHQ